MLIENDAVHELVDWLRLEQRLSRIHSKAQGEKAWPPYQPDLLAPYRKVLTL